MSESTVGAKCRAAKLVDVSGKEVNVSICQLGEVIDIRILPDAKEVLKTLFKEEAKPELKEDEHHY